MSPPPRYELFQAIGAGSMGEVYFGVLRGAAGYKRPVVLKRARPDNEDARQALVFEANLAAALNHPNVVHTYELVEAPEGMILAMEYLAGVSLRTLIDQARSAGTAFPWQVSARIVADAARGLHHAHHAVGPDGQPLGIVHRDVSPSNLLVTEEGITKVVDFGIARSSIRAFTGPGSVKGTLPYMSPEQTVGGPLDWRSDVFSLGVILHELLAGRPLFRRKDQIDTLDAVRSASIPTLEPHLPTHITHLVARMLTRNASERTISMGEAAEALERSLSHGDVAAFVNGTADALLRAQRELVRRLLSGQPSNAAVASSSIGMDASGTLDLIDAMATIVARATTSDARRPPAELPTVPDVFAQGKTDVDVVAGGDAEHDREAETMVRPPRRPR